MIPIAKAKLLEGKKGLIVGIANINSIASGCAKGFRTFGAELAVRYLHETAKQYVEPLCSRARCSHHDAAQRDCGRSRRSHWSAPPCSRFFQRCVHEIWAKPASDIPNVPCLVVTIAGQAVLRTPVTAPIRRIRDVGAVTLNCNCLFPQLAPFNIFELVA